MGSHVTVEADRFGATMGQILGELADKADEGGGEAVSKALRTGKRELLAGIEASGIKEPTGRYRAGWQYRRKRTADGWSGEIGNRDVPGLPHLLEMGHAKVGGGRVDGREHIATAAGEAFDELERGVREAVDAL